MQHISIWIDDQEYLLRYEIKQQLDILKNGPKKLDPEKKDLKFTSPMDALRYLDSFDAQVWLFQKALEWAGSGAAKIDFDKAAELRQAFLEQGDADDGQKYNEFIEALADALSLNVAGASAKKLKAKADQEQKKKKTEELADVYEAKMIAEARIKERAMSPGSSPPGDPQ